MIEKMIEKMIKKVVISNISDKKMSTIMFAIIATQSKLLNTLAFDIDKPRSIQSGNFVEYLLAIPKSQLNRFEELAGVKLSDQGSYTLD
jgi:hypothetical protein